MESSGWVFSWDDGYAFKPDRNLYAKGVPADSFWGFKESGSGSVALELRNRGMLALDFGNSLNDEGSQVAVSVNGLQMASARGNTLAKLVQIPFRSGDTITIAQDPSGVIVVNSIVFSCVEPAASTGATSVESAKAQAAAPFARTPAPTLAPQSAPTTAPTAVVERRAGTRGAEVEQGEEVDTVEAQMAAAAELAKVAAALAMPQESPENARRSEEMRAAARDEHKRRADASKALNVSSSPVAAEKEKTQARKKKEKKKKATAAPVAEETEHDDQEQPEQRLAQDSLTGQVAEAELEEEREVLVHAIGVLMGSPWEEMVDEATGGGHSRSTCDDHGAAGYSG